MNVKVANRYVDLLTHIIDKKVRNEGRDFLLYKDEIMYILDKNNYEHNVITEKIFKDTVKWFKERNILITEGSTSNIKYKLHPNFKFTMSQKPETVFKQGTFIIGQLQLFSENVWDDAAKLYEHVISNESIFQFIPETDGKHLEALKL